MRDYIIKQLRDRSCVRGKQRTWISELSDDQLYEVFLRLRSGESAKQISRYIQKKWGVFPESTPHSVSQGILKFQKRIAHLLLAPSPESGSLPTSHGCEGGDKLKGLEGIEHITELQLERINKMVQEEKETGIRHTSLSKDIHALSALTKTLTKAKEWEMVHEGVDPVKRYKLERERERLQQRWSSLMDELGEEGRNKMIEATDRLLEGVKKETVPLQLGPDGKYHPVESDETLNSKKSTNT